jgi:hypothetical protein
MKGGKKKKEKNRSKKTITKTKKKNTHNGCADSTTHGAGQEVVPELLSLALVNPMKN